MKLYSLIKYNFSKHIAIFYQKDLLCIPKIVKHTAQEMGLRWRGDEMGNCGGEREENEENEANFKGNRLGKKRFLESTLRSGLPVLTALIRTSKHCFKTWKDTFVFRNTKVNY